MFHRPPQLRPDGLKLYIVDITLGTFAPKKLLKSFAKIADGVISLDKKNISWNVLGHDFLSNELCVLLCVHGFFFIPELWRWKKLKFNHKQWEILNSSNIYLRIRLTSPIGYVFYIRHFVFLRNMFTCSI